MNSEELIRMRGRSHGHFPATAEVAQGIKDMLRWGAGERWATMPAEVREALDALATKMARAVCGDWRHGDHWRDIGGYALLAGTAAARKGRSGGDGGADAAVSAGGKS